MTTKKKKKKSKAKRKHGQESDHLGTNAENEVRTWAGKAGFHTAQPDKDRSGWDQQWQLPRSPPSASLLEATASADLVVQVQVKGRFATTRGSSLSLSLSNWRRHILSLLPVFVVVVVYDKDECAVDLFVVHIGKDWVAKVLKRLRKESLSGRPPDELGDLKMRLKWTESDRVRVHPTALRQAIEKVAPSLHEYVIQKQRWLEELGYSENRFRGTLGFAEDPAFNSKLAELAVGLRKSIPLSRFSISEVRFDMPRLQTERDGELALHLTPQPFTTVDLMFRSEEGLREKLCGEAFTSHFTFPFLPKEEHLVRCVGRFFSVVVADAHAPELQVVVGFDEVDAPGDIQELGRVGRILIAAASRDALTVELEFGISEGKASVLSAHLPSPDAHLVDYAKATSKAAILCALVACEPGEQAVPEHLLTNYGGIALLHSALAGEEISVTVPVDKVHRGEVTVVLSPGFATQSSIIRGLVCFTGQVHCVAGENGKHLATVSGPARSAGRWKLRRERHSDWSSNQLPALRDAATKRLENGEKTVWVVANRSQ